MRSEREWPAPFHAARMVDIDPATATVDDLVRLPPMIKQESWQVRAERASGTESRPACLAVLEAGEPPHASTPLFDVATGPAMRTIVISAGRRSTRCCGRWRPRGRPTSSGTLGGRAPRPRRAGGELDIRPVRVSTNSEPLGEEDRDAISPPGPHRSTTSGARPRSGSRPSAAVRATACTSARTR
jgi:hypothetical protein